MSCVGDVLRFVREYQSSCCALNKCSVFMKRPFKRRYCDLNSFCNLKDSKHLLCKELDGLIEESQRKASVYISAYGIVEDQITLRLCRSSIIKSIFLEISESKSAYGCSNVFSNKSYKLCCAECRDSLTQLRLSVAARVLAALLSLGGASVSSDGVETINLSCTGSPNVVVSPVRVTSAHGMSEEEFVRVRTEDILAMSNHKNMSQKSVEQLVNAAVTFDLLSIKLEKPLHLDVSLQTTNSRKSNNKGATFVLYNYARLCAILEKFDCCVNKNIFQPLSSLDDINYSLFTEEDEWSLVFDLLAEWPVIVAECQDTKRPALHRLTSFLSSLASTFSVYYRHTRVLNEGLPHMVPLMEARIHLLLAIRQVFLNAFAVLGISAPTTM
uniref:DALR anticodon binding domain-containing protein n=1 Tax=Graphocephala atropunctata TaxID=36148 RepID=A0A1B6MA33_9HEMI